MADSSARGFRAVSRVLVAAVVAAVVVALIPASAYAAPPRPVIYGAQAFDAPKDKDGGVMSPYVACTNWRVEPRVRWVLKNLGTDEVQTFRWRGGGPGMHFPRVAAGEYRSKTVARCRGNRAVRVQTLEIEEKTKAGTVSRAEFRRVGHGMSRARVRRIIGNGGRDPWTWRGKTTRTYDMMTFWRWSTISFRDGRVVGKQWNVDHD